MQPSEFGNYAAHPEKLALGTYAFKAAISVCRAQWLALLLPAPHSYQSYRIARKLPNVIELASATGHETLQMLKRYLHPQAGEIPAKLG